MALAASGCGTSVTGTAIGGGGAKPSRNCTPGMRHALTPVPRTPTNTVEPSGDAAMNVTVRGKASAQRGRRSPSSGRRAGVTQPSGGIPAAPVIFVPRGTTKWDSRASPACTTRTCAATASPAKGGPLPSSAASRAARSEEHTSELQSQSNLVCRLLLEKKKQNNRTVRLQDQVSSALRNILTTVACL